MERDPSGVLGWLLLASLTANAVLLYRLLSGGSA
jgi:hypothetical protein